MKKRSLSLVRYIATHGKALKCRMRVWSFTKHAYIDELVYAERELVVDEQRLVSKVEEVSMEEYQEWLRVYRPGLEYNITEKCS